MLKRIKQLLMIISVVLLVFTIGAAFRVKNEISNENKPSTENSASDSTNDSSSTGSGESTPDENGDFPYYSGDGEVYQDDYIYLNPEQVTVHVGDTFKIEVITADNSTPTYDYLDTSNCVSSEIVTIDEIGNVTAIAAGTAYIHVDLPVGNYFVTINVIE